MEWIVAITATGCAAAVCALVLLVYAWRSSAFGPLEEMLRRILLPARWATWLGAAALVLGCVSAWMIRRGRMFRSKLLIAASGITIIVGVAGAMGGALLWRAAASPFGWDYQSMPSPGESLQIRATLRRILEATAVIVAPNGLGFAPDLTIGAGAIVKSGPGRAWIMTCSHVAMPYASVSTVRDAATALPVWVYFSNGRHSQGIVKWTAQPPLDAAIISVDIDSPPPPISILDKAEEMIPGAEVIFSPNPFRDGWQIRRGTVIRRESHVTPAGEYSLVYTDLPLLPGDSGSGLYDASGQFVGLNTWRTEGEGGAQGISLPTEAVRKLMTLIETDNIEQLDEYLRGGPSR